jgi:hypothetical protein
MALKSWFPLTTSFEHKTAGENYSRWTPYNEKWFTARCNEIQAGAQPLPVKGWQARLRGEKDFRKLKPNYLSHAKQFLGTYAS